MKGYEQEFWPFQFAGCPRCGAEAYEQLRTHCLCLNCNFSPDLDLDLPMSVPIWAIEALQENQTDAA